MSVDRERVQGLYDTFNRVWGDDPARQMDLMREYADPEIELVIPSEYLDIGDVRGYDGLERWMSMAATVFESWHYVVEDVLDAGEDRVLALVRLRVRGRASGAEMQFDAAHVLDFAGGRLKRLAVYRDRAEGLAAANLA